MFEKFKAINNKEIYKAVRQCCLILDDLPGARYFLCKGRLVIVFDWYTKERGRLSESSHIQDILYILTNNLPGAYVKKFELWDMEHIEQVPAEVLDKTGYINISDPGKDRY